MRFYSEEVNIASMERLRLEADLRRSVDQGDFHLLYQPKVDVSTGKVVGAEALLRWVRQNQQTVSPSNFIPIAEESDLILQIGEWVIEEAARQLAQWHDQGIDLNLSVNISARQFFESDLVAIVARVIEHNGIEPSRLTLEMTESLLMEHVDEAVATLNRLHRLGVAISIDDFGTGFSSMSYLKRFKVSEVKIDRSFVMDVEGSRADRAVVTAVTYLAHQLGARVCAEGVETAGQLNFVGKVKCDEYQGFICSRPVPVKVFVDLYHATQPKSG
jgi:EAL domain-containing protein (putative c-di-GMP-specific phosphodiesterase class I)